MVRSGWCPRVYEWRRYRRDHHRSLWTGDHLSRGGMATRRLAAGRGCLHRRRAAVRARGRGDAVRRRKSGLVRSQTFGRHVVVAG